MAADCPDSPIDRRTAAASRTTSRPSTSACPPSGRSNVVRMRTAVVLPAPFGPSTPSTVPRGTDRSMPRSACTSPNDLVRPSTRIAASPTCATVSPLRLASPCTSARRTYMRSEGPANLYRPRIRGRGGQTPQSRPACRHGGHEQRQPVVMAERAPAQMPRAGSALMQQRAAGGAGDRHGHAAGLGLAVSARVSRGPHGYPRQRQARWPPRSRPAGACRRRTGCAGGGGARRGIARSLSERAGAQVSARLTMPGLFRRDVTDGKLPRNAAMGNMNRTHQH